jgi:hypothetical protein
MRLVLGLVRTAPRGGKGELGPAPRLLILSTLGRLESGLLTLSSTLEGDAIPVTRGMAASLKSERLVRSVLLLKLSARGVCCVVCLSTAMGSTGEEEE